MPKMRKIALEAGKEQGIQEISPKATEELGVTCCFAAKAAERSGKKQGILEFTVQLSHDETGIAFIQFPQKLFCKLLSEAVAVCRSHQFGFRPSRSIDSTASVAVKMEDSGANGETATGGWKAAVYSR